MPPKRKKSQAPEASPPKRSRKSISLNTSTSKPKRTSIVSSGRNTSISKTKTTSIGSSASTAKVPKAPQDIGELVVMGDNDTGQLGLGEDVPEAKRPQVVKELKEIIEVAVGGMHTVVLTKSNQVFTCGCNDDGALGRDTSVEGSDAKLEPVTISGKVIQISAGDSHSAALTEDGSVYVWGSFRDSHGVMGLFDSVVKNLPQLVKINTKFIKVASGSNHLILLASNGDVYSCGCGEQGQLGRFGEFFSNRNARNSTRRLLTPTLIGVPYSKKIKTVDVWAGSFTTFILNSKGNVYACGLNNHDQLGIQNIDDDSKLNLFYRPTLSDYYSGKTWVKICGGDHHTLALDKNGDIFTHGRKEYGRLGLGEDCEDAVVPTQINLENDLKVVDISCGSFTSFAITNDGKLYSWGMAGAILGQGDIDDDVCKPKLVQGKQITSKKFLSISGGGQHAAALVKDV